MNLEKLIEMILEVVIPVLELAAVFIVVEAAVVSFVQYICGFFKKELACEEEHLSTGVLTALEFMLAAEILKTLVVRELSEILMLGGIVLIRAVLGLELKSEKKEKKSKGAPLD